MRGPPEIADKNRVSQIRCGIVKVNAERGWLLRPIALSLPGSGHVYQSIVRKSLLTM